MPDMMQKDRIQKSVILDEQFKFEFQLYRKFPISIKSVVYTSCSVGKVSSVGKAPDLGARGSRFESGRGHSGNSRIPSA